MKFDFFFIELNRQRRSLLTMSLAKLEKMNFERLITKDEMLEIEAISNYDLSAQIQLGVSHILIEWTLFEDQMDHFSEFMESFGGDWIK